MGFKLGRWWSDMCDRLQWELSAAQLLQRSWSRPDTLSLNWSDDRRSWSMKQEAPVPLMGLAERGRAARGHTVIKARSRKSALTLFWSNLARTCWSVVILTSVSSSRNTIQDEFPPKDCDKLRAHRRVRVSLKQELNNKRGINWTRLGAHKLHKSLSFSFQSSLGNLLSEALR